VVITLLGVPLAYLLANGPRGPMRMLTALVALPLALPPLMSGLLLLYVVGPYTWLGRLFGGRLTDTVAGIVLAQTFVAAPFLVIAARAAFAGVDPALTEVGASLGHGPLSRFWRFAIPAALPGIAAGLLLAWLRAFGEFGATVILAYHPYSLPVFTFVQFDSTGLPGTVLPIVLALGAALIVLTLVQLPLPRIRVHRRRAALRAVAEPPPPADFRFDVQALAGEFRVEVAHRCAGGRLALLGPSGAGKTLTLRSLLGTHRRARVEVQVGGEEVGRQPPERRRIGYVPQQPALLPRRTVAEQVLLGRRASDSDARRWIAALGLSDLEERYPHQLSGGQQRRVALARALADRPRLLLLDEPFTGLDTPARHELIDQLRVLQTEGACSTVLVTHDPDEATLLADEIVLLDAGRALAAGPTRTLFTEPGGLRSARLLGIPNANRATVVADGLIESHGAEIHVPTRGLAGGTPVIWAVDPADVRVCAEGGYRADLLRSDDRGLKRELTLRLADGLELLARVPPGGELPASIRVALDPADILLVGEADGAGEMQRAAPVESRRGSAAAL